MKFFLLPFFVTGLGFGVLRPIRSSITRSRAITPSAAVKPDARVPYFINPSQLPLRGLLPSPPLPGSIEALRDLAEVHRIENSRTAREIKAAQYDDTHEDLFVYQSVLGPSFTPESLPATMALSRHMRNDAGIIDNPLKEFYRRLRPYNVDPTLHPACETNQESSYPSGHSVNGYLYAFALAGKVPEKHNALLRRANDYAHNRVVCGAHYQSDVEASRRIALLLFGNMLATPKFRAELLAAQAETRSVSGLPAKIP